MAETMEVVRQQVDDSFIKLLNKIREWGLDGEVDKSLLLRFVSKVTSNYPQIAVHIFEENYPVDNYNETMLEDIDKSLVSLNANDEFPKGCQLNESQLESIKNRKLSDAGNLATLPKSKIGVNVMLTVLSI